MYLSGTDTGVTISMVSTPAAPYAGAPTQLVATLVNGTTPVTSGTVTFTFGGTTLGTATLDPTLGTATITTSALTTGTDNIVISYPGATGVNSLFVAASATVPLVVAAKPVPVITITAAPNAINAGASTTLTATVTSTSGTPTGTVTITTMVGTGATTTVCSTTTLAASGIFSCNVTTLAAGLNTINATYGGDGTFSTAVTTTAATVNVTALPTTTTLSITPATANLNQSVTMTATIGGLQSSPALSGGTVTFKDTFTPIGGAPTTLTYGPQAVNATTGVATYTTTTLGGGTHVVVATFANDSYYGTSTSASSTVVVTPPGFYVTLLTANGVAVPAGNTFAGIAVQDGLNGLVTFSVQSVGGYTGTVTPACDLNGTPIQPALPVVMPLPADVGCLYTPANFVITSNTTSTETLALTTQKLTASNRVSNPILAVFLLPGAGLALFGLRRRTALKMWQRMILFCLIFAGGAMAVGGLNGCGTGTTNSPAGSYLVPITFTDGVTTQSFQITLSITH